MKDLLKLSQADIEKLTEKELDDAIDVATTLVNERMRELIKYSKSISSELDIYGVNRTIDIFSDRIAMTEAPTSIITKPTEYEAPDTTINIEMKRLKLSNMLTILNSKYSTLAGLRMSAISYQQNISSTFGKRFSLAQSARLREIFALLDRVYGGYYDSSQGETELQEAESHMEETGDSFEETLAWLEDKLSGAGYDFSDDISDLYGADDL